MKRQVLKKRAIRIDHETGRSQLDNLSKEEVIDTIIMTYPAIAFCHIAPFLSRRINRRTTLFIEMTIERADQKAKALAALSKKALVDIAFWASDHRINSRYGSNQRTLPTERRKDIRRSSFTLRKERELELDTFWARQWKNRSRTTYKKNVETVLAKVAKRKPAKKKPLLSRPLLTRRQSKKAAVNWVAAMRSHNAHITHQSEPEFICGKC